MRHASAELDLLRCLRGHLSRARERRADALLLTPARSLVRKSISCAALCTPSQGCRAEDRISSQAGCCRRRGCQCQHAALALRLPLRASAPVMPRIPSARGCPRLLTGTGARRCHGCWPPPHASLGLPEALQPRLRISARQALPLQTLPQTPVCSPAAAAPARGAAHALLGGRRWRTPRPPALPPLRPGVREALQPRQRIPLPARGL